MSGIRLKFDCRTGTFYDTSTNKIYTSDQLGRYFKDAENHKNVYKKVVEILQKRIPELNNLKQQNPNVFVSVEGIIKQAFNEARHQTGGLQTGGETSLDPASLCNIFYEKPRNPFLAMPFWLHEKEHQDFCQSIREPILQKKLKEVRRNINFEMTKERELRKEQESPNWNAERERFWSDERKRRESDATSEANSKASGRMNDPLMVLNNEISAYQKTVEGIEIELEMGKQLWQQYEDSCLSLQYNEKPPIILAPPPQPSIQPLSLDADENLQRQPTEKNEEEEEKETLVQAQKLSSHVSEVAPEVEGCIQSQRGSGHPLPEPTRAFFELHKIVFGQ